MNAGYTPANLPQSIVKLVVRKFTIVSCDHWWPDCARKLKHLQLVYCTVPVAVLFEMLRHTPNLRTLVLYSVKLTGSGEPNFRLDRLESLTMYYAGYGKEDENKSRNILDGFDRLTNRLENLVLQVNIGPETTNLFKSIRTMQSSLQYLDLTRCSNVLAELTEMKQLKLTGIALELDVGKETELWTKFCKMHPLLETLTIAANNTDVLLETGRLLPKLKTLSLNVDSLTNALFLKTMPGLTHLEIAGSCQGIRFYNASCPNLEQFALKFVETVDVLQFLGQSPKLKVMRLDDCRIDDNPNLTRTTFPNLTTLVLNDPSCDPYFWYTLILRSLKLEELQLICVRYLDEQAIREFCVKLKRLKRLTICASRYFSARCANYIIRHCRALEVLDADCFTAAEYDRIEAARNIRVMRPQAWSDDEEDEPDEDPADEVVEEGVE